MKVVQRGGGREKERERYVCKYLCMHYTVSPYFAHIKIISC